jgi:hypothetical protein
VKIALVAPPQPQDAGITPPLPLAYVAAVLEQQRHIVRIYDLALCNAAPLDEALIPLRAFRPHLIAVASGDPKLTDAICLASGGCEATVVQLGVTLRTFAAGETIVQALWQMDEQPGAEDEQNVIFNTLLTLDDDLDSLPFPARHLLSLEQYPLCTPSGELQTTILAGQPNAGIGFLLRNPLLIVAELRSIAREHGIRHVVFLDPPLTHDLAWLCEMLYHLASADLGVGWEGRVRHQHLTPELLQLFQRAGCEVLGLQFNAVEVLDSRDKRAALSAVVDQAHELGLLVRAHIELEPPYDAIPVLVDMSATFGLDDVRFSVQQRPVSLERSEVASPALEAVAEMARSRYRSRRSRQFFIERFGPQLGPMLWRVGRAGLLGRTWQRYADGGTADRASA